MPAMPTRTKPGIAPAKRRAAVPPEAAANRRAELIRVAARLFREKGFNGTTTRDIAHAVGMR